MATRKPNGQFEKGVSGNPGGKPKRSAEIRAALEKQCPEAIKVLVAIMKRKSAKDKDRIDAAKALLTWGQPKPKDEGEQTVEDALGRIARALEE